MDNNILQSPQHAHFVGMDGISMSALATIMLRRGWSVSGSDLKQSSLTRKLVKEGAIFFLGHAGENVNGADIVVHTAAVKPDNPELMAANAQGIPIYNRAEFLGALMSESRYGIGVSGSHGKTTTTALIGMMLEHANLDPTVLVGGELDALGGNVKVGRSPYFVTEACEYVETFLALKPFLAVILNIDADHLDYFGDLEHIVAAFRRFAAAISPTGFLVACSDDANVREILPGLQCRVITYGLTQGCNWWATNIEMRPEGGSYFDAYFNDQLLGRVKLGLSGRHNICNALSALAVGHILGISYSSMSQTLQEFSGTQRRFEIKGNYNGATIIDDYAHHPTEIRATLSAARAWQPSRLIATFQPHTYTRTKSLLKDFGESFKDADMVIVTDIYAAREKDTLGITSEDLAKEINLHHANVKYVGDMKDAANMLSGELKPGDMLITMGAGDIHKVGENILESTNENANRESLIVNH